VFFLCADVLSLCDEELAFVFVGLGAGLAVGAVAEAAKRSLGLAGISDASKSSLLIQCESKKNPP